MLVEFSRAAESDLLEMVSYLARDNPTRALSFVDELEEESRKLSAHPSIGAPQPELGAGLRLLPCGRYPIFYRPLADVVRIERVLHSARDIRSIFDS